MDGPPRDPHVLTHSFPTRRSSDLVKTLGVAFLPTLALLLAMTTCLGATAAAAVTPTRQARAVRAAGTDGALMEGSGEALRFVVRRQRSEEHTSELQSLMRSSYAVFCLKKKTTSSKNNDGTT